MAYIKIEDWMTQLGLTANQLIIYALIYGINKSTGKPYEGSCNHLSQWVGDRTTVLRALKEMTDKGILIKTKVGNFCKYAVADLSNNIQVSVAECNSKGGKMQHTRVAKYNTECCEMQQLSVAECNSKGGKMQHNIINNIKDNIKDNTIERYNRYTDFAPPTIEEIESYCIERNNNISPTKFYDWYTAKGWQGVKDWKAKVRVWETNSHAKEDKANKQIEQIESLDDFSYFGL